MTNMLRFDVKLNDKADWPNVFNPNNNTLFVACSNPPEVGVPVRVDLTVGTGAESPKVILRGQTIARQVKSDASYPQGFSVALDRYEREKTNYLNGFVRGGLLNLRKQRRLPVRLRVIFDGISGLAETYTRDINEEGIFVLSNDPLPETSEVQVIISFPNEPQPLLVAGIVSHTVVVEDEDVPGMGIRFDFSRGQKEAVCKLIDKLEQKFIEGALPDEFLL